jgi:hypothetical protein
LAGWNGWFWFLAWNLDLSVLARLGVLQCILECVTERLMRAVLLFYTWGAGQTDELRVCSLMLSLSGGGGDEPESLILAQSERWRHA